MASTRDVVITSAVRTPIGAFLGTLSSFPATRLGSIVIEEALKRNHLSGDHVDEVIMGNVLTAGEGQAPARQAALGAGLPETVECMTINKVCGSGLKAVMLAAQSIALDQADIIVAGGMESMSNVPYYLPAARNGFKMGHQTVVDGMILDGLWDVYNNYHMGNAAELCARECNISREQQDDYAKLSYERAISAQKNGWFADEIVSIRIPHRKGDPIVVDSDEEPARVRFEKIPALKPVFDKEGTITAANASSINDGAAAVVLMSSERARALKIKPLATIVGQSSAAKKPEWFTTAPSDAIKKVLHRVDLNIVDIDLFEINEAFAVVSLANNDILKLDVEKVNIHGGAVALGHPIGASGTRILVTLLHGLIRKNAKRGLASLCIGGGEASALVVER
jgi:acetyl-CoA C-acetyltransferase